MLEEHRLLGDHKTEAATILTALSCGQSTRPAVKSLTYYDPQCRLHRHRQEPCLEHDVRDSLGLLQMAPLIVCYSSADESGPDSPHHI